jgi:hypothetical protein
MPTPRTVLVAVTIDDGVFILQPPRGSARPWTAGSKRQLHELVAEIVGDPTQPVHELEPNGFDVPAIAKGVGRWFESMGKDEPR